jgi:hypothetical protein
MEVPMDIVQTTLPILYGAILVEAVVNMVHNLREKERNWKYWVALVAAIITSVLVTYNWNLDLFSLVLGEGRIPFVGAVLTGVIVSRGANVFNDLVGLIGRAARPK